MKLKVYIALLLFTAPMYAQNKADGLVLLKMSQWNKAKELITSELKSNANDSRALYEMGEYYFLTGNKDSAKAYYQKGTVANPDDVFNFIGLFKINLVSGDSITAQNYMNIAKKMGKKKPAVWVELAKVYALPEIKKYNNALTLISQAKTLNSKFSEAYLLESKIALEEKNMGKAASMAEQAIYFDSLQFEAYFIIARIYAAASNTNGALEYLNRLLEKAPYCTIAYREIGDIYYNIDKYMEAKKAYETYISTSEYTADDKERYAYLLFFAKEYDKSQEIIKELSKNDPDNHIMLRLLSYMHFEKGEYEQGIQTFTKFFERVPSNKVLVIDYEYFAKTLEKAGADSLAVIQYQQALNKDTSKVEYYGKIGELLYKKRKFIDAANYFKQAISHKATPVPSDYFQYARAYYFGANAIEDHVADSALYRNYLLTADSILNIYSNISPNSYLGYFWRARANAMLDPETKDGRAKPYYEKALEIFNANPSKFQKEILEVYSYLGFYYFVKKEMETSKTYWEKILEIDPKNEKAQKVLQEMKPS